MICVKTPAAAQKVSTAAARLGLGGLPAAVAGADALARVAETPADVVLVDTASRPDAVGFTRRVLTHSPRPRWSSSAPRSPVSPAAGGAGARGLIRGGDCEELVAAVAKALMLLLRPSSMQAVPVQRAEAGEEPDADGTDSDPADATGSANGANGANPAATGR